MAIDIKHRFFKGTISQFKDFLKAIENDPDKMSIVNESIIWIHPNFGEDATSDKADGWIYANGSYFHASATNQDIKEYKLLGVRDIDKLNKPDDVVTYGYLQKVHEFEVLK